MEKSIDKKELDTAIWNILDETEGSYTRGHWTDAAWKKIIVFLLSENIEPKNIIWVMMSKHMRWCGEYTFERFKKYYNSDECDVKKGLVHPNPNSL